MYALDVLAMGRIWRIEALATNSNETSQSTALFVKGVLKTIGASDARQIATISPIKTQSGATFVWKSDANVQAARGSLHHTLLHCVKTLVTVPNHSVTGVVDLGNVRCASPKSVPKFDGLLVKMFA